ncbi:hypothetical protein WR25_24004 [Diploscapter pachys]|uniref:Cytochrome P450 n=1 Tax=Diploscapter pachys TaxID=2018661 RepID=A0A2A2KQW5_9BILA|nr:hypothetical protein WR25_24004 [Diploscapter pachys]
MILLTIFLGIILYFVAKRLFEIRHYPPGPAPLPFIGNTLQLGYWVNKTGSLLNALKHFKEVYGPIFTLHMGPAPVVMICDYDLAIEAMVKNGNNFQDRWENPTFSSLRNYKGLATSSGDYSVEQRRFALHTLRNLGVSRNIMEKRILEEWHIRFGNYDANKVFKIPEEFDLFTGSVIYRLLFSVRFTDEDEKLFTDLKAQLSTRKLSFLDAITPVWALKIPYFRNRVQGVLKPLFSIKDFIEEQLKERIDAVNDGTHIISDEPDDFVDAFLVEMKKREKDQHPSSFTMETLICDTFDLFHAGQDTTSTTLSWAVCFLLNHPEVEEKIRKELLEVTNGNQDLSQADRQKTPYFNAALNEIQRLSSIITTNLTRYTSEDVEISGVLIRKGIPCTAQLSMILSDERYFPEPEKFNPDRFMGENKPENQMVAFGLGKRACLGESLARAELYLILGNLIQRYKFEAVDKTPRMEQQNPASPLRKSNNFQIRLIPVDQ